MPDIQDRKAIISSNRTGLGQRCRLCNSLVRYSIAHGLGDVVDDRLGADTYGVLIEYGPPLGPA